MTARRLGSSEIAAVVGFFRPDLAVDLPKTKTAGDVFARLRWGLEQPGNARTARGLDIEPFGLDYYAEHVGPWWREKPLGEWWTVVDRYNPDFTASPDAYDAPTPRIVIELKSWSEKWGRHQWGTPGTSEMATRYLYQAQWLLARCEAEAAHVLVLFGNDVPVEGELATTEFIVTEPAIYPVGRDDELISWLDEMGERFLSEFVRPGIPPPVKPHANRRKVKELLDEEHGEGAAAEWYARCDERSRQLADAERAADSEAVAGDEAG